MTRLLAVAMLLFLSWLAPADARIVALLYDDSGSMARKDNLPSFGAQLLVSTLDGRTGEDKLLTAVMSHLLRSGDLEGSITEENISATDLQRQLIGRISGSWKAINNSGTPHNQIEGLIRRIATLQADGEEAFLIILTDGSFSETSGNGDRLLPTPEQFRGALLDLKPLLKGPLRVEFVLMGPDQVDPQGQRLGAIVEAQGVRRALLDVFNDDPQAGRIDVSSAEDLTEAFKQVIARIASTDVASQQDYIERGRDAITVKSPLAIRRLISISLANRSPQPLAQPQSGSIPVTDSFVLSSAMPGIDEASGWRGDRLRAETTHFLMEPPIPAGTYSIRYDADPRDVFLLFQSAADLALTVIDGDGQVVPPGTDGVVRLPLGSLAKLAMTVSDESSSGKRIVPLDDLGPNLEFRPRIESSSGDQDLQVNRAAGALQATADLPTSETGTMRATAQMRLRGFVSTYASPLVIEVVDVQAAISIASSGFADCPQCRADEIGVVLAPGATETSLARIGITVTAPSAGQITVTLPDAPPGLRLYGSAGSTSEIPLTPGDNNVEFTLAMPGGAAGDLLAQGARLPVRIRAQAKGGLRGSAEHEATIVFFAPNARLVVTGHSRDASGATPFTLDMDALRRGREHLDLVVYDRIVPLDGRDVVVEADNWFLAYSAAVEGDRITVTPRSRLLCGCFLSLFEQGPQTVRVRWKHQGGLQEAATAAELTIEVPFRWTGAFECLRLVLVLFAILYLAAALVVWFRAQLFPRGAGFDSQYNKDDPVFRELHRYNWTWLKAFLWPVFGVPNERRSYEGLHLVATRGGANILMRKSDGSIRLESTGDTIAAMKEQYPAMENYRLSWGDAAERRNMGTKLRMILLKNAGDRPVRL
jgi:hypothetical protein